MPDNNELAGFFTTLVSFFASKKGNVKAAWLGYLLSEDRQHHLFLAIYPRASTVVINPRSMFEGHLHIKAVI